MHFSIVKHFECVQPYAATFKNNIALQLTAVALLTSCRDTGRKVIGCCPHGLVNVMQQAAQQWCVARAFADANLVAEKVQAFNISDSDA